MEKPSTINWLKTTAIGLFLLNAVGLLLCWPIVMGFNWIARGMLDEYLTHPLTGYANLMVNMSGLWLAVVLLAVIALLAFVQFVMKRDKLSATLNVIVGIVMMVFLIAWMGGIGAAFWQAWHDALGTGPESYHYITE